MNENEILDDPLNEDPKDDKPLRWPKFVLFVGAIACVFFALPHTRYLELLFYNSIIPISSNSTMLNCGCFLGFWSFIYWKMQFENLKKWMVVIHVFICLIFCGYFFWLFILPPQSINIPIESDPTYFVVFILLLFPFVIVNVIMIVIMLFKTYKNLKGNERK